jgi:hypothetical protein
LKLAIEKVVGMSVMVTALELRPSKKSVVSARPGTAPSTSNPSGSAAVTNSPRGKAKPLVLVGSSLSLGQSGAAA